MEFNSVRQSVGGYQNLINQNCKGAEGPVDHFGSFQQMTGIKSYLKKVQFYSAMVTALRGFGMIMIQEKYSIHMMLMAHGVMNTELYIL